MFSRMFFCIGALLLVLTPSLVLCQEELAETEKKQTDSAAAADPIREMQSQAVTDQKAAWGHWGHMPDKFSTWTNHSNRLVPVYTFGLTLDALRGEGSAYASEERLKKMYGTVPDGTLNPTAMYFDQTDIYRLQAAAVEAGFSNIILMVFDGMDWQTTRAAAMYKSGKVYESGPGFWTFHSRLPLHADGFWTCVHQRFCGRSKV